MPSARGGELRPKLKGMNKLPMKVVIKNIIGKISEERDWILCIIVLTAIFIICNLPLILGRAVGLWDTDAWYCPYYILVADFIRSGHFLLWNPWSNAGLPMMGDPQVGAFSPLTLLIGFFTGGTTAGFIFYWLFMWWTGGVGIIILSRHFKVPAWGGCLIAIGYLFCGAYTGHAEHTSIIIGLSFLPFIIWRLDTALNTQKWRPVVEAGAIWGLGALSSYPGLTILSGCFAGLWGLGRYFTAFPVKTVLDVGDFVSKRTDDRISCGKNESTVAFVGPNDKIWVTSNKVDRLKPGFVFASLFLMCLIGSLVLSPTYFSFIYEGVGHNARVETLSRAAAISQNALAPGALATFSGDYLSRLKQINPKTLWSYTDVSMLSIYTGTFIPILALLFLNTNRGNRWRWWLLLLGLLNLGCAMGIALPLRGWLYDLFYPSRFFRHAGIFRLYFIFCLVVLALLGIRDLYGSIGCVRDRLWRRFRFITVILSLLAISSYVWIYCHIEKGAGKHDILAFIWLLGVWGGAVYVAIAGKAWVIAKKRSRLLFVMISLTALDAIFCAYMINSTVYGYSYAKRWCSLDEVHSGSLELTQNGLSREASSLNRYSPSKELNNDHLITKKSVFHAYTTAINPFQMAMMDNPALLQPTLGMDRIWFAPKAYETSPTWGNFDIWANKASEDGKPSLLVHTPYDMLHLGTDIDSPKDNRAASISDLPPLRKIHFNLLKYLPNELSFQVDCPENGWLLVTDRWARSWIVEINSRKATVYGGNFIFRAIKVDKGRNTIRFNYRPMGYPWLLAISWGLLAGVCIWSGTSFFGIVRQGITKHPI